MHPLLTSFLDSLKAETKLILHLEALNMRLRDCLLERRQAEVSQYSQDLKAASNQLELLDKERENLWKEVKATFSLSGSSFYAQVLSLHEEHATAKEALTQAYQELKLSYQKLRNSTVSLEIYTDTALDITQSLLEGIRLLEDDKYSSKGNRQTKEVTGTKAFLINEEL